MTGLGHVCDSLCVFVVSVFCVGNFCVCLADHFDNVIDVIEAHVKTRIIFIHVVSIVIGYSMQQRLCEPTMLTRSNRQQSFVLVQGDGAAADSRLEFCLQHQPSRHKGIQTLRGETALVHAAAARNFCSMPVVIDTATSAITT